MRQTDRLTTRQAGDRLTTRQAGTPQQGCSRAGARSAPGTGAEAAPPAALRLEGRSICPPWPLGTRRAQQAGGPGSQGMSPGFRRVAWVLTLMLLRKDGTQSRHHRCLHPAPGAEEARVRTEHWERAFIKNMKARYETRFPEGKG